MSDIKPAVFTNEIELEHAKSRLESGGTYWIELRTRSAIPLYTAADLAAARRQALEEAADLCDERSTEISKWRGYSMSADAVSDCADAIRALITTTPAAQDYARANPFGGPAAVFDAAAERIRAGEPLEEVMRDYGLSWVPREE